MCVRRRFGATPVRNAGSNPATRGLAPAAVITFGNTSPPPSRAAARSAGEPARAGPAPRPGGGPHRWQPVEQSTGKSAAHLSELRLAATDVQESEPWQWARVDLAGDRELLHPTDKLDSPFKATPCPRFGASVLNRDHETQRKPCLDSVESVCGADHHDVAGAPHPECAHSSGVPLSRSMTRVTAPRRMASLASRTRRSPSVGTANLSYKFCRCCLMAASVTNSC